MICSEIKQPQRSQVQYTCEPWNISIVSKSRRGQRSAMEDRIWFEPPIRSGDTTYIQCCAMDGHSTFPLELETFFESCKQKLKRPFDDSHTHQKEWQTIVDSYEHNWSSEGGLVCHFVSISFSSSELTIVRYQLGDCNSLCMSQGNIKVPLMYVHNTSQKEEYDRVLPYLENGRVGGVLACTRVVGNKELKSTLPNSLLDPILRKETHTFCLPQDITAHNVFLCGTDGLMSDRSCIDWLTTQRMMSGTQIADACMARVGTEDNVSFIVIEFQYLRITL